MMCFLDEREMGIDVVFTSHKSGIWHGLGHIWDGSFLSYHMTFKGTDPPQSHS